MELVNCEVISKQKELVLNMLLGCLQAKIEYVRSRAVPQIQLGILSVNCVDLDSVGKQVG